MRGCPAAGVALFLGVLGFGGCREEVSTRALPPVPIILIVGNQQDPFDAALIASAQEVVKNEFNTALRVIEMNPANGGKPQAIEPSYLVAGILLACRPNEPLKEQLAQAKRLGVRVFAVGNLFSESETEGTDWQPDLTIASEVEWAGYEAVRVLIQHLESRNSLPRGTEVVIVHHDAKVQETALRKRGMESALLVTPAQIKTLSAVEIGSSAAPAVTIVEDLLRKHPELRVILCTDGDLVLAAVQAAERVHPQAPPAIGGFDVTPETRAALQSGKIRVLVDSNPGKLGRRATVFALNQERSGRKIHASAWVRADILTPEGPHSLAIDQPASAPSSRN